MFRVEGPGNARIAIDALGNVNFKGDAMLFLNFGDEARAQQFLAKRLEQGFDGTVVKSFDVPALYAEHVAQVAVPERLARTGTIIHVDVTKTATSYGFRPSEFQNLMDNIIKGSGR